MLAGIIIFPAFSAQPNSSHHTTMNPDDFGDVNKINAPVPPASRKSRLNLTAMVGMLMFLLVTFVLFSMALARLGSVEAKLPVACCPSSNSGDFVMVVQVSADGRIFVDKDSYDISELPGILKSFKDASDHAGVTARVLVTGDDYAKYGAMVRVIDYVKASGIMEMLVETNYRATGI
jgi:biopolymer transport protein ExbD